MRSTFGVGQTYLLVPFGSFISLPNRGCKLISKGGPNVEYVTADLQPGRAMLAFSVTDIPFDDGMFDAIICSHVLEHVEDDRKGMAELFRVLRPGGWALLQSPVDQRLEHTLEDRSARQPRDRERVFGQRDHVRSYGRDYADRLRSVGFEVEGDDYVGTFHREDVLRYGLTAEFDRGIYLCVKPA